MALALVRFQAGAHQSGRRLDDVAREWLSQAMRRPLSKSYVRRLIIVGAIRSGPVRLRQPRMILAGGEVLEARVRIDPRPRRDHPAARLRVLFEDAAVIAVDKPAGLLFHAAADPSRPHLVGLLRRQAGCAYLGVHQRLDRDTSGVVLLAKDPAANLGLATQFARHEVEKVYHAITLRPERLPPHRFVIANRLQSAGRGGSPRMASVPEGGQPAETAFRLLQTLDHALLIEARPSTGRKHQIRAHLAGAGLPIVGDRTYGTKRSAEAAPRVMLHAARLILRHPLTGETLSIESPYPDDFKALLAGRASCQPAPLERARIRRETK